MTDVVCSLDVHCQDAPYTVAADDKADATEMLRLSYMANDG